MGNGCSMAKPCRRANSLHCVGVKVRYRAGTCAPWVTQSLCMSFISEMETLLLTSVSVPKLGVYIALKYYIPPQSECLKSCFCCCCFLKKTWSG